jgi:ethanolaminephosphotransferase
MFFSTWETYHTHTLYLGYINGPTEGLILSCLIMAAGGFYGPAIWRQPLSDFFGDSYFYSTLSKVSMVDIWVVVLAISLLTQIPFCVWNVYKARSAQGLPMGPVFLEWTTMACFTASTIIWVGSPYSTIQSDNHIVLFCLTMSFVFGRMTTKIILAHLTKQPFPYWTVMLWPLVGGALLFGIIPALGLPRLSAGAELWYLRLYFVFAAVVYGRWAHLVITSICNYLGINCLTIPSSKLKEVDLDRRIALEIEAIEKERAERANGLLGVQNPPTRLTRSGSMRAKANGAPGVVVDANKGKAH